MEDTKIITARRAYEFRRDDLRISMLSLAEVRQQIQQTFAFQIAEIAPPAPTFGPVQGTLPPGVVFDFGTTRTPGDYAATPIRFLHFEPTRIVVDVAGPSSAIDYTFQQLREILNETPAPDGTSSIGDPERVRNYSEITVHFDFDLEDLIGGPFLKLAKETFGGQDLEILPLGFKFRAMDPSDEARAGEIGTFAFSRGNQLEYRAETSPKDRIYFSVTELPTDQHLAWLESLNRQFSKA
jgi:hypothetical protein